MCRVRRDCANEDCRYTYFPPRVLRRTATELNPLAAIRTASATTSSLSSTVAVHRLEEKSDLRKWREIVCGWIVESNMDASCFRVMLFKHERNAERFAVNRNVSIDYPFSFILVGKPIVGLPSTLSLSFTLNQL